MEEITETEVKEEKTEKFLYFDMFAIFISIFGTVWCLSYGIFKLVNLEVPSALFNLALGSLNATCVILNITSFIKRRFNIRRIN